MTRKKKGLVVGFVLGLIFLGWWVARPRLNAQAVWRVAADVWSPPVFAPDGERIAFERQNEIVVTTLEGVTQAWSFDEGIAENLQWLNDTQIVFQKMVGDTYHFQFWALDLQSGESSLLNENIFNGLPSSFSVAPSRDKLAFVQDESLIYIWDFQTASVELLQTPVFDWCVHPQWSVDESHIIYICYSWRPRYKVIEDYQIWRTNIYSGEIQPMSALSHYEGFSLSPDEKQLIYLKGYDTWPLSYDFYLTPVREGQPNFNRSIRLNLSEDRLFNLWTGNFFDTFGPSSPSWSPDGRCIAFSGSLRTPQDDFEDGLWYTCLE